MFILKQASFTFINVITYLFYFKMTHYLQENTKLKDENKKLELDIMYLKSEVESLKKEINFVKTGLKESDDKLDIFISANYLI